MGWIGRMFESIEREECVIFPEQCLLYGVLACLVVEAFCVALDFGLLEAAQVAPVTEWSGFRVIPGSPK